MQMCIHLRSRNLQFRKYTISVQLRQGDYGSPSQNEKLYQYKNNGLHSSGWGFPLILQFQIS